MIKVYYNDMYVLFGAQVVSQSDYAVVGSAQEANIRLFSGSTMPLALICEDWVRQFELFMADFQLIEAGGGVVSNPQGELLMILRNGRWDLPKGKLEAGEEISHCALREVEEECGLQGVELGGFIGHTFHIYSLNSLPGSSLDKHQGSASSVGTSSMAGGAAPGKNGYILKRTWWWQMSHSGEGQLTPQTSEGITDIEWVTQERISARLEGTFPAIKELIMRNLQCLK